MIRKGLVLVAAVAALGALAVTVGATTQPPPPDHTITVTKEVENGPVDASYVVEVNCTNDSATLTFGESGGTKSVAVSNDAGECNVVETQTNGAVVDIEGNGDCNLPESTWVEATTEPAVAAHWNPAEGSTCQFEVSNFFEPTTTPPPATVEVPVPVPVPVVASPPFTG